VSTPERTTSHTQAAAPHRTEARPELAPADEELAAGASMQRLSAAPDSRQAPRASDVVRLQRRVGNQAVQRLLANRASRESSAQRSVVQRGPNPPTFTPAPAPGVNPPSPPVPGTPAAARAEAVQIGQKWGTLLGERDVALETLQNKWAGVSVWDRMSPQERSEWARNAEAQFAALPALPEYKEQDQQAAQEDGFNAGVESGYSGAKFAAFLVNLGSDLAIALFSGLAARGLKLPRFISTRMQASLPELLGSAEYEALKDAAAAAQAIHPELAGLTTEELVAIRAYTGESWSSINAALRLKDGKALLRQGRMIGAMRSGLAKLPTYSGRVTRTIGMSVDDAAKRYVVGETVVEDGFTSTTKGPPVKQREGNISISIESKTGRDVTSIAVHKEGEILFPPGTKFKVTEATRIQDAFIIRMTEVP
jgi:hypothetical protein